MNKIILCIAISTGVLLADFTRDKTANTVVDNETKLVWQDDADISSLSWNDAKKHCAELTFASHSDWRLPNKKELDSLIDEKRSKPSISEVFKNTEVYRYWSSDSCLSAAGKGDNAWYVNFSHGHKDSFSKEDKNYVRCVRAGE